MDASLDDGALIGTFTGMAVEMAVNQGLVGPLSGPKYPLFGLYKPNSGGGGWTRTSDKGLMSSPT
jgi:hypothetical protein